MLINDIRMNPRSIIPAIKKVQESLEKNEEIQLIKSRKKWFAEEPSKLTGKQIGYDTLIRADRAISALSRMPALPPLKWSNALFLAAQDHCNDQASAAKPSILTNILSPDN